jgi:hypothetical protein
MLSCAYVSVILTQWLHFKDRKLHVFNYLFSINIVVAVDCDVVKLW